MPTIAQQIRAELKAAFPGVSFTCKTRRNTANITYVDGPAKLEVEEIAKKYHSGGYDAHADCHYGSNYVYVYRTFSDRLHNEVLDAMEAKGYSRECEGYHWSEAYDYFITGQTTKIDPEERMALLAAEAAEAAEAAPEFVVSPALAIVPADFNPRNNPTFTYEGELVYVVKFGRVVAGVPATWICQGVSGSRYEVESAAVTQYTQKAA